MKLYIRVVKGQITDHPILEENLMQAMPGFDPNNLPHDIDGDEMFKPFERLPIPAPSGPYVDIQTVYQLYDDGVVRDTHIEVPYSEERRAEKRAQFYNMPHLKGWVFNEDICSWDAPTPYPGDENTRYAWDENLEQWALVEQP